MRNTILSTHSAAKIEAVGLQAEPRKRSSAKIGTIQRRLAWPLRKDDTHKSRMYHFLSQNLVDICRLGRLQLCTWLRSYSVMVITKDFESFDPGSSPGRTFFYFLFFEKKRLEIDKECTVVDSESLPRWRN